MDYVYSNRSTLNIVHCSAKLYTVLRNRTLSYEIVHWSTKSYTVVRNRTLHCEIVHWITQSYVVGFVFVHHALFAPFLWGGAGPGQPDWLELGSPSPPACRGAPVLLLGEADGRAHPDWCVFGRSPRPLAGKGGQVAGGSRQVVVDVVTRARRQW